MPGQSQKINYQKKLDAIISAQNGKAPSLLLHSCCAPCSSYVLEYLSEYFEITVLFYNPNIAPAEEYERRDAELHSMVARMNPHLKHQVQIEACTYDPKEYYTAIDGLQSEPEGGERCTVCFHLRLEEAARFAKRLGKDYFTTSLTISPMKDAQRINAIGFEIAEKYGVKFLPSDFKKRNGYRRSTELSKEYGLYRQDFCGCVFSKKETEERRQMKLQEAQQ